MTLFWTQPYGDIEENLIEAIWPQNFKHLNKQHTMLVQSYGYLGNILLSSIIVLTRGEIIFFSFFCIVWKKNMICHQKIKVFLASGQLQWGTTWTRAHCGACIFSNNNNCITSLRCYMELENRDTTLSRKNVSICQLLRNRAKQWAFKEAPL